MKYYTVEFRSPRAEDETIIIRGVKAPNSREAHDLASQRLTHSQRKRYWESKIYLSKHRPRRYKHSKHTNKLRRPWAVLAKNAKRQHFNVLNRWSNLHYHRLTYVMYLEDCDDTHRRLPIMDTLEELFPDLRSVTDLGNELAASVAQQSPWTENDKARLDALIHAHYESEMLPEHRAQA